jgi:prepilin-type N-terminal cleavage/methylation domain-containing protein
MKSVIGHRSSVRQHRLRLQRTTSSHSVASGFTIVETLIVLAIAGLILLIVFEAIPTLERSSRNNQRKQDVSAILEAVSHYELNNSGNFPQKCGDIPSNACNKNRSDPSYPNDNFLLNTKLTYYDLSVNPTAVSLDSQTATGPDPAFPRSPVIDPEKVEVFNYEKCDPDNQGAAIIAGAGFNDVVALYALELGNSGFISQCLQL